MRIFLDKGHGGTDIGGSHKGMTEAKINSNVVDFLAKMLREQGHIVFVFDPIVKRKYELSERINAAIKFKAEISISVHHNDADNEKAQGAEVWAEFNDEKSKRLAKLIMDEFEKLNESRGVKFQTTKNGKKNVFAMLNIPNCINILTEFAFLTDADANEVDTYKEQEEEAKAIAVAIKKFTEVK